MNVATIESVIRTVIPVLAGLMFVITLVLALVGFGKWSRARLKAAVRKYGPFAVGFFIVWGVLLADSQNVTQDEKDDLIGQEEDDEEENAVLGGLLLGSPRLMGFQGGLCGFESGGPEPAAAGSRLKYGDSPRKMRLPSLRRPTSITRRVSRSRESARARPSISLRRKMRRFTNRGCVSARHGIGSDSGLGIGDSGLGIGG